MSKEARTASLSFKATNTILSALPMTNKNAEIAFVSNRDGIEALYVMNADGSGQTKRMFVNRYEVERIQVVK
ncbi:hypothetical protein [Trichocoleus sp. FACHB-262]|uniref:hypothetical protein n=1 Tax=Trichocoleus sp. FACHB-262 TaxID=2692869 RepID=UPI0016879009|nr:hypothetical protein [Trichocoleus sp. FACHB-262]MBD2120309.1 hypothetical protein [Trichocoleus sp. FACHB-262]